MKTCIIIAGHGLIDIFAAGDRNRSVQLDPDFQEWSEPLLFGVNHTDLTADNKSINTPRSLKRGIEVGFQRMVLVSKKWCKETTGAEVGSDTVIQAVVGRSFTRIREFPVRQAETQTG